MLTVTVTVNLDHQQPDNRLDLHALYHLAGMPDGAHLIVVVGSRTLLTYEAVAWLTRLQDRLHVEIHAADAATARRWYDALRSGEAA